jgi:hypothetical protein
VPASGVEVALGTTDNLHSSGTAAVTNSQGRFAIKAGWSASTTVSVVVQGEAHAFLNSTPTETRGLVRVTVRPATRLEWWRPTANAWRQVALDGYLALDPAATWASRSRVYLQRSADGKTGWSSVGSLVTGSDGWFQGTVATPSTRGYFRMRYLGTTTRQPSIGRTFTLARRETRIAAAKVTPTSVPKGRTITVSGRVQKFNGTTFVNLGSRTWVSIMFRRKGDARPDVYDDVRTSATGAFSIKVEPMESGYWSARWFHNNSWATIAIGPETYVKVT